MQQDLQKLIHSFASLASLGEEVADTKDFEEMIRASLHLVLGTHAIRRGLLAQYEPSAGWFRVMAVRGARETQPSEILISAGDADELVALGPATMLAGGLAQSPSFILQNNGLLQSLDVRLILPLIVRNDLVGLMLLGEKATGEDFSEDERAVIGSMARHIAVGIHTHRLIAEVERRADENRRLYDGLRAIYKDTVRAFAAAIDIKDKYTQGHSERVGRYCEVIGREMGWSEEEVEGIAVAGYLHDIGKLIVERDIINAPYRIDAKSSSELNRHPAAGYEILSPINHPYADIPLTARYHHERLDGRGYPEGLTGDQIPLTAKIVSLADSFDAMTTDRPYRRRRSLEEVIQELRQNTGTQFAPEVVAPFCRALLKEVNGEVKPRRIMRLLGKDYVDSERIEPLLKQVISELEPAAASAKA